MNKLTSDILVVGGGAAGLSAALAASAEAGVTVVDDNPHLGGQIWRAEMGTIKSAKAKRLVDAVTSGKIKVIDNAQVFSAPGDKVLLAETLEGTLELEFNKLIIATGARERFLPFPGWTLPNVFGAGGLQALVKGGLPVADKRIVVSGTGALLLAVAEYLKSKGANVVAIAEQTSAANLRRFTFGLWRSPSKLAQGIALRARLLGIPYLTNCWVTSARCESPRVSKGDTRALNKSPLITRAPSRSLTITLTRHGKSWPVECDYLACGFHLVPNLELPAILNCEIKSEFVAVDDFQQTSIENVYCAGEPTGIAGVEASLIEGRIAGLAAAGQTEPAKALFGKRDKAKRFGHALNKAFVLRDELRTLAESETTVCRCEDVPYEWLTGFGTFRDAKLQTRCGMGPCQGRICGAATDFMFGWERPNVRPPIFPVKMENL